MALNNLVCELEIFVVARLSTYTHTHTHSIFFLFCWTLKSLFFILLFFISSHLYLIFHFEVLHYLVFVSFPKIHWWTIDKFKLKYSHWSQWMTAFLLNGSILDILDQYIHQSCQIVNVNAKMIIQIAANCDVFYEKI